MRRSWKPQTCSGQAEQPLSTRSRTMESKVTSSTKIEGKIEEMQGRLESMDGEISGDPTERLAGAIDQAAGRVKSAAGKTVGNVIGDAEKQSAQAVVSG